MRVLIVRMGAMGDVLHAMPAVAALRARHPNWHIGWAVEHRWRELLHTHANAAAGTAAMPLVDAVHEAPVRAWKRRPLSLETARSIGALRHELRRGKYDLCVDMQGIIRAAVVGRMAGAEAFVGRERPREMPSRWLYSRRVRLTAAHVVEQGCELLGAAVGLAINSARTTQPEPLRPSRVTLPTDPASEAWADEVSGGEGFCFIAPTAGWGAKAWPAERFGAVAAALGQLGLKTLVNAGPGDNAAAPGVVAASAGYATAIPDCSIGQLIALLRRARLVIAGDTGPLHLAAALEKPVVGIYGPTDPARNGPYCSHAVVLRDAESVTNHARVHETDPGMLRVSVEDVVEGALELLQG